METDSGRSWKILTRKAGQQRLQSAWRHSENSPSIVLLFDDQDCTFRKIALAPEPIFHRGAQAFQRHARANFHPAVTGGNGVVKDLIVREIAHAETVQPLQRTGMALPCFLI